MRSNVYPILFLFIIYADAIYGHSSGGRSRGQFHCIAAMLSIYLYKSRRGRRSPLPSPLLDSLGARLVDGGRRAAGDGGYSVGSSRGGG